MSRTGGMVRGALLTAAVMAAATVAFAQELTVSGEVKTGFYIQQEQLGSDDPVAIGGATNNDGESGGGAGRIRMDFRFAYENMGLRVRFQIEPRALDLGPFQPTWNFAYAYGNMFNNQFTVAGGLLGESPWGTGGPRLNSEPEAREYISYNELSGKPYIAREGLLGVRFEYKPFYVPGLNVGFVLNQPDRIQKDVQKQSFGEVFGESIVGAAYEHDMFAVRVGYRLDSAADKNADGVEQEGGRLTWRVEEKALATKIDGMKIWLNGLYYGLGCKKEQLSISIDGNRVTKDIGSGEYLINWLYWQWDTPSFIAGLDVGFSAYQIYNNSEFTPTTRQEYQSLEFIPAFYYKLFDNLLQAGLAVGMGMEFGPGKTYKNAGYQYFTIEPQIRLNINSNSYVAAVYDFTDKYAWFNDVDRTRRGEKSVKHSFNIRAVYAF